jgi:hypothetical protein
MKKYGQAYVSYAFVITLAQAKAGSYGVVY